MSIQQNKIRAIIEKIWSKVKEPKAMSGDGIVDAIDDVYEAGENNGIDEMFETILGHRNYEVGHSYAFDSWAFSKKTFKPKQTIKFIGTVTGAFYMAKSINEEPIDLATLEKETGIMLDFSEATTVASAFWNCTAFSSLGTIDVSNTTGAIYQMFYSNGANGGKILKWIEKFIVSENTLFNLTFQGGQVEHCIFVGTIGQNGLNLSQCDLDYESVISAVNCLKDYSQDTSGTVWKVNFGTKNLDLLSDEEKLMITNKGWDYA